MAVKQAYATGLVSSVVECIGLACYTNIKMPATREGKRQLGQCSGLSIFHLSNWLESMLSRKIQRNVFFHALHGGRAASQVILLHRVEGHEIFSVHCISSICTLLAFFPKGSCGT